MDHDYIVIFHKANDRHAIVRVDGPVPLDKLIEYANREAGKLGCSFKFSPLCPPTQSFTKG